MVSKPLPVALWMLVLTLAAPPPVFCQGATNKVSAAPPAGTPMVRPELGTRSLDKYVFGPGDKITLRVVESRDEPVELVVSPTGEIEVPLLGKRLVLGKTIAKVESELKAEYEKDYYFNATVQINVQSVNELPAERVVRRIYVTGQVAQQGAQEIPPGETYTVSKAILKAGGFASFANGRKVRVVRKGQGKEEEKIVVDVMSILEDGKVENDIELKPDDLIIVPEKLINF